MSSTLSSSEPLLSVFSKSALHGKVAVITGGGSGIGFRIAEVFVRLGARVGIVSRSLERVEEAARVLNEVGGGRVAVGVSGDVRKYDEVVAAFSAVTRAFRSPLDIVVNAAAGNFLCPASTMSSNAFRTVLEIDALGTFHGCRAAWEVSFKDRAERVVKHKSREEGVVDKCAVILNITATLHYRGDPLQLHAGAAKAAVDALTRHLGREWGPYGIRVVGIAPGPIAETEGARKLVSVDPDGAAMRRFISEIPLKRMGEKLDIGALAAFLVSDLASYITGETVVADGGHWMSGATEEIIKGDD